VSNTVKNTEAAPDSLEWVQEFLRSTRDTSKNTCWDFMAGRSGIGGCPIMACPLWYEQIRQQLSARTQQSRGRKYGCRKETPGQEISQATEDARKRIESIVFGVSAEKRCCIISV